MSLALLSWSINAVNGTWTKKLVPATKKLAAVTILSKLVKNTELTR